MVSLLKHMLVPMLTRLVLLFIVYCTGAYLNSGPGLVQFPRLPCVLSFLTVLGDPTFFLCFLRSFRGVFFFFLFFWNCCQVFHGTVTFGSFLELSWT